MSSNDPFNSKTLNQKTSSDSQKQDDALGSLAPDAEKTHLLVVEDEPTIRQLFAALLTAAGYSVSEAVDGFAALEEVRRKRPALILSDLNMPRMTGFELLSVVRRRFPAIRVIAMSGAFSGDSIPDGVSADAFYEKSGRKIDTLVDVIEDILVDPEVDGKRTDPAPLTDAQAPQSHYPSVALWVTRRGNPLEGPYILLTCYECLRSFPHYTDHERTMQVQQTACVFCGSQISYALLDPSITHHPGYAPSKAG
jgi:CheY-like chemotaxis protein